MSLEAKVKENMKKAQPALAITLKELLPSTGKKMSEQQVIQELIKMGIWDPKARGVKKKDLDAAAQVIADLVTGSYTFEPTDKEGNFNYYEVAKNGKYLGDLAYHRSEKWLGRVPASNTNPEGFFNHPDKEAIRKAFEQFIGKKVKWPRSE